MYIILRIEQLASGGPGVSHYEGKIIFLPYALPGDLVEAEITNDRGSYAEARIIRVLEPSPQRVEAPSPYFFRCGGCQWMHLSYDAQLFWKKRLFLETLQKIAGISFENPLEIIPSSQFGYRNRIRLKVQKKKGGLLLGYYRTGSHEIIDIEHCLIADRRLNAGLPELRDLLTRSLPKRGIYDAELLVGEEEKIVSSIICRDDESLEWIRNCLPKAFGRENIVQGITLQDGKGNEFLVAGKESVSYSYRHPKGRLLRYQLSPAAFSQSNYVQNSRIIDTVLEYSGETPYSQALDLYCGIGNLTLPIALNADRVTGIENGAVAVKWAIRNAKGNGIKNSSFLQLDALEGLDYLRKKGEQPVLILLDPPRTGAKEVVTEIARSYRNFTQKIIYISCHPATFSRDVKVLAGAGFQLEKIRLIDMFPHSYHTEIVALLSPLA